MSERAIVASVMLGLFSFAAFADGIAIDMTRNKVFIEELESWIGERTDQKPRISALLISTDVETGGLVLHFHGYQVPFLGVNGGVCDSAEGNDPIFPHLIKQVLNKLIGNDTLKSTLIELAMVTSLSWSSPDGWVALGAPTDLKYLGADEEIARLCPYFVNKLSQRIIYMLNLAKINPLQNSPFPFVFPDLNH